MTRFFYSFSCKLNSLHDNLEKLHNEKIRNYRVAYCNFQIFDTAGTNKRAFTIVKMLIKDSQNLIISKKRY